MHVNKMYPESSSRSMTYFMVLQIKRRQNIALNMEKCLVKGVEEGNVDDSLTDKYQIHLKIRYMRYSRVS